MFRSLATARIGIQLICIAILLGCAGCNDSVPVYSTRRDPFYVGMSFDEASRFFRTEIELREVRLEYKAEGPKPGDIVYGLPYDDEDGKFILFFDSDKRLVQIEERSR